MSDAEPTLFDKIGGPEGVKSLVNDFYERVLEDEALAPFFKDVAIGKLQNMQYEFFGAALGGDVHYSGLSLSHAHQGRGIEREHYERFVNHLLATLKGIDAEPEDTSRLIARINTYVEDVIGGGGLDG